MDMLLQSAVYPEPPSNVGNSNARHSSLGIPSSQPHYRQSQGQSKSCHSNSNSNVLIRDGQPADEEAIARLETGFTAYSIFSVETDASCGNGFRVEELPVLFCMRKDHPQVDEEQDARRNQQIRDGRQHTIVAVVCEPGAETGTSLGTGGGGGGDDGGAAPKGEAEEEAEGGAQRDAMEVEAETGGEAEAATIAAPEPGARAQPQPTIAGFIRCEYACWNRRLVIRDFAVAPAFRRQGIGRRLMRRMLQHGRRAYGARQAWLEVSNVNVPAVKAYQRYGFVICGLDLSLYENTPARGEVALFMSRPL